MEYKVKCPNCGTRLSRWRYFTSISIHYKCRQCGGAFRMTAKGFAITFAASGLLLVFFVLGVFNVIRSYFAFDYMAGVCGLAVWLLPNLTPVERSK